MADDAPSFDVENGDGKKTTLWLNPDDYVENAGFFLHISETPDDCDDDLILFVKRENKGEFLRFLQKMMDTIKAFPEEQTSAVP